MRPKFKKILFPAPDQPLENVATQNIFWVICDDFFFFFWLPEIVTGSAEALLL